MGPVCSGRSPLDATTIDPARAAAQGWALPRVRTQTMSIEPNRRLLEILAA